MRENDKEEKVKHEMDKIKTINIELEHSKAKLLSENERLHKEIKHLKKIYKDQFDLIKKTRALSKEQNESLIGQLNSKSMENADLRRQIQDKEQGNILWGIVKQAKAKQPLDNALDIACKHAKRIQELLVYVRDTCPNAYKPSEKMIAITPMNKVKKVRIEVITPKKIVHPKETTSNSVETPKPEIKVYSRRPKQIKSVGSSKKAKIIESKIANNSEPNHLWGSNATDVPSSSSLVNDSKFLGIVQFENDQVAKIMGYGDYQLGNVIISRVYYVEWLGHNLFSVGQFCDADLEVAFQKNTCFIWNLEGVDPLLDSRDTNLYKISLDDMLKTSLACLLSKASKTKSCVGIKILLSAVEVIAAGLHGCIEEFPNLKVDLIISRENINAKDERDGWDGVDYRFVGWLIGLESKVMRECCFVVRRDAWSRVLIEDVLVRMIVDDDACDEEIFSAVHTRDQDDPHDDAHPKGENSAKRQKTSEYKAYVSGEPSSGQLNVEEPGPSTLGDEHHYHIDQMKNFLQSDIVWESKKEIFVSPYPRKIIPLVQSCQRDPKATALSLINQDLLYLKKGNSGPEKIVLSLHKFPAIVFNDDDIEERTSRWVNKCIKKFNPYARYGVENWKNPHAKIFYIRRQKEPGRPKEEIYSNSKIVQVIKTYWELGHEHKFITEIVARRANDCIVSITEPDYKNLNKNDIEDMYLLIVNNKVPDYANTGLLWSLSVFIRSSVIWERVHDFQLGIESYQQKINLTAPTITFPGIEEYDVFSIVYEPVHGIIYTNSKKEKRVMRHSEIHKFCDATLRRTLEGLKSYYNDVKYGYVQKELTNDEVEFLKLFEEEIEVRLNYRDQMRRWEMYVNGRPLGPRRERPE
ncbi:hypothetical protein Tco_0153216 [Tanacetum coccineum]